MADVAIPEELVLILQRIDEGLRNYNNPPQIQQARQSLQEELEAGGSDPEEIRQQILDIEEHMDQLEAEIENIQTSLTSLRENNSKPENAIDDWPHNFSLKPVMGGRVAVSVPQEEGDPITYNVWLRKDAEGEFNQFVLVTPEKAQEVFDQQAARITDSIHNNVNPITGARSVPGEMTWYNPNTKERQEFSEDQTPEERQALEEAGFKAVRYRENVLDDPQVAALHEQVLQFQSAVERARQATPATEISQDALHGTNRLSVAKDVAPEPEAAPEPIPEPVPGLREPAAPPPVQQEFEAVVGETKPDYLQMGVYLAEAVPADLSDAEREMYQASVSIMNGVRGGLISKDDLDGLIEQFNSREGGEDYAAALEQLKETPPPNILAELGDVRKGHRQAHREAERAAEQDAAPDAVEVNAGAGEPVDNNHVVRTRDVIAGEPLDPDSFKAEEEEMRQAWKQLGSIPSSEIERVIEEMEGSEHAELFEDQIAGMRELHAFVVAEEARAGGNDPAPSEEPEQRRNNDPLRDVLPGRPSAEEQHEADLADAQARKDAARAEFLEGMGGKPEGAPEPVNGEDGQALTVNVAGENTPQVLWKGEDGQHMLLGEQEISAMIEANTARMSELTENGDPLGAVQLGIQSRALAQSLEQIMDVRTGKDGAVADVDASGGDYAELDEQEIANKVAEELNAPEEQPAGEPEAMAPAAQAQVIQPT